MNFVKTCDYTETLLVNSPTYGTYRMTKIATFDCIKSIEYNKLLETYDLFHKLKEIFVSCKIVTLESKLFGPIEYQQSIEKFDFYIPLIEDNIDWKPLPNSHKSFKSGKLPIAYKRKYMQNKMKQMLGYNYI